VLVLQHVDLHDRLARCALVSRLWASAAAIATAESQAINLIIDTSVAGQYLHPSMHSWLCKHGRGLTSIKAVQHNSDPTNLGEHLQLPCAVLTNLRSLSLQGVVVELSWNHTAELSTDPKPAMSTAKIGARTLPSDSSALAVSNSTTSSAEAAAGTTTKPVVGPTSSTPTSIRPFGRVGFAASRLSPALQRLQSLQLVDCAFAGPGTKFTFNFARTLRRLPGLTELRFSYSCSHPPVFRTNTLDAVTSLQRLQRLELMVSGKVDLSFLSKLPVSLTALYLEAEGKQLDLHDRLDLRGAPLLQGLTGLQELTITRIIINPSTLAALSSTLTSLQLEAASRPGRDPRD
jgi:hypothetical protein